jgi:hypothetical protein
MNRNRPGRSGYLLVRLFQAVFNKMPFWLDKDSSNSVPFTPEAFPYPEPLQARFPELARLLCRRGGNAFSGLPCGRTNSNLHATSVQIRPLRRSVLIVYLYQIIIDGLSPPLPASMPPGTRARPPGLHAGKQKFSTADKIRRRVKSREMQGEPGPPRSSPRCPEGSRAGMFSPSIVCSGTSRRGECWKSTVDRVRDVCLAGSWIHGGSLTGTRCAMPATGRMGFGDRRSPRPNPLNSRLVCLDPVQIRQPVEKCLAERSVVLQAPLPFPGGSGLDDLRRHPPESGYGP